MKFRGPPGSVYAVNNLGALQTVMYKRELQRRREGEARRRRSLGIPEVWRRTCVRRHEVVVLPRRAQEPS